MILDRIICSRSLQSVVAYKNDNSANHCFLIMFPNPYFTSFSFLERNSPTSRLYFNGTW